MSPKEWEQWEQWEHPRAKRIKRSHIPLKDQEQTGNKWEQVGTNGGFIIIVIYRTRIYNYKG